MMNKLLKSIVAIVAIFLLSCTNAFPQVYVRIRPVVPVIKVAPPAPHPHWMWIDGSWRWDRRMRQYVWVDGYWVEPVRGHVWIAGFWRESRRGYVWVPGRWRRR